MAYSTNPIFTDVYLPLGEASNGHLTQIKIVIANSLGGTSSTFVSATVLNSKNHDLQTLSLFQTGDIIIQNINNKLEPNIVFHHAI